jgi:hypothetical protein
LRRSRVARRDFPKQRGFFFQGEANECGHFEELQSIQFETKFIVTKLLQ